MGKSCWSCINCINDYFATGTLDSNKIDSMTEEMYNFYTENGGENCLYYEEIKGID